jgi:ribosome maturation factor RimP
MKLDVKKVVEDQTVEIIKEHEDLFLVQVKIDAKNNIKVFLDGDKGITIGQCTGVNRSLYKFLEEQEYFPNGDFSLEVSSFGAEESLILNRQYTKNIGRELDVLLKDGTKWLGKLMESNMQNITLEITKGKGKKAEISAEIINLEDIKSAKIQIKF